MGVTDRAATVADAVRGSTGRHPLWRRLVAIPPMLRDTLTGRWSGAPRLRLFASLLGLLYVISPIDLMPEILLGPFGLGDDLAIAVVSVAALMSAAEAWLDRDAVSPGSAHAPSGDVIEGEVLNRQ